MSRVLAAIVFAISTQASAMAGFPPSDMSCHESPFPNPATQYIECSFPPHISRFTSPSAMVAFPSALLVPRNPAKKVKLSVHSNGYNAYPTNCADWGFSDPAKIVMKECPAHYPSLLDYPGQPMSWGGPFEGELSESWRIAATVKYAMDHYASMIDWGAGLEIKGASWGGTTAILQSLIMPEPFTKAIITVVHAVVPNTTMVKQDAPQGMYWKNPAVRLAWGNYNWTLADIRTQASGRVYYRFNGSPPQFDNLVVFDTAVFPALEAQRVPVFGTWHNCGHAPSCAGINLPLGTYTDTNMSHRLDQPQIAFTHSSANSPLDAPIGHWNLGLGWRDGMLDNKTMAIIPLRYLQHTGIGGGVPDQPPVVTFDVTVRNLALNPKAGEQLRWYFGAQSGMATVDNGLLTIQGLALVSSTTYTVLEITK